MKEICGLLSIIHRVEVSFKYDKHNKLIPIMDKDGNKFSFLINGIIESDDSTLWLCTEDKGAIVKVNTIANNFSVAFETGTTLNTIYKDTKNLLWIGTRENGLLCYDPLKNRIIEHFLSDHKNPNSISGNSILTIYEDRKGNLWLGTNIGLNMFDREKKTFYHFTESNGLPHNWVYFIFEDTKSNLWINTLKGVSKFNPSAKKFNNYDVLQGIVSADRSGIGCQTDNGEIYLVSQAGLIRFHPDSINDNQYIPPIVITNISVSGKNIQFNKEINTSYEDNNISFEFAALSYVRSEKNLFSFMLEGVDEDWINAGTQRFVSYTNLDPGEYIFKVKGSNNDGIWNEAGTSIKLIILPPWWKTIWAYIIYTLIIIIVIYFTWKVQLRRLKIKHDYETSKFEAEKLHEVDEIKTQFFTNISHEFRTPLTLIIGPVKQIAERIKNDKDKEELNIVHKNARKLLGLVNQLLDISKLESGSMKLHAVPQNVIPLLKGLVLSFASYAERKRITLKFTPLQR